MGARCPQGFYTLVCRYSVRGVYTRVGGKKNIENALLRVDCVACTSCETSSKNAQTSSNDFFFFRNKFKNTSRFFRCENGENAVVVVVVVVYGGGTPGGQVRNVHQRRAQRQPEPDIRGVGRGQRGNHGADPGGTEHRDHEPAGGRPVDGHGGLAGTAQDPRERGLRLLHAGGRGPGPIHGVRGPRLLRRVHQGRGARVRPAPGRQAPELRERAPGQRGAGPSPDHAGPALHSGSAEHTVTRRGGGSVIASPDDRIFFKRAFFSGFFSVSFSRVFFFFCTIISPLL